MNNYVNISILVLIAMFGLLIFRLYEIFKFYNKDLFNNKENFVTNQSNNNCINRNFLSLRI